MPKLKNAVASDSAVVKKADTIRLSLGSSAPPVARLIMEEIADPKNLGLVRRKDGQTGLVVKIPGHSELQLSRSELIELHGRSTRPVAEGDSVAAVFDRSFSDSAEGGFSARFSDKDRARTLTISGSERGSWCDFLAEQIASFDDYEGMIAKAEAEANAPKDNSPK